MEFGHVERKRWITTRVSEEMRELRVEVKAGEGVGLRQRRLLEEMRDRRRSNCCVDRELNRSWSHWRRIKDENKRIYLFPVSSLIRLLASLYDKRNRIELCGTRQCLNCCYVSLEIRVPSTPVVIGLFFTQAIGCLIFFLTYFFVRAQIFSKNI